MNKEKLAKMQQAQTPRGKGVPRRKVKKVHRTATGDDKKLQSTLKKLAVNPITGIEEVNMFKEDGTVIHFQLPKVQASIASNTFTITGNGETKDLKDLFPGIIHQMGPENVANLRKMAEKLASASGNATAEAGVDSDDDDVPELVENFDDAAAADM